MAGRKGDVQLKLREMPRKPSSLGSKRAFHSATESAARWSPEKRTCPKTAEIVAGMHTFHMSIRRRTRSIQWSSEGQGHQESPSDGRCAFPPAEKSLAYLLGLVQQNAVRLSMAGGEDDLAVLRAIRQAPGALALQLMLHLTAYNRAPLSMPPPSWYLMDALAVVQSS